MPDARTSQCLARTAGLRVFAGVMNQHNGQSELSLEFSQEGEQRSDLSGVVFVDPFVIPPLDSRKAEDNPRSRNRVTPLFGGQFLDLGLELTSGGRRSEKRTDDAEAKMRPTLMGP
jgi:hypothetical protein